MIKLTITAAGVRAVSNERLARSEMNRSQLVVGGD